MRPIVIVLLTVAAVGCSSSEHYPGEEKRAESAVKEAKSAGADKHSSENLASARQAIADARAAESAASKDEEDAKAQLRVADGRGRDVERRLSARRSELRGARAVRDDLNRDLEDLESRRDELAAKGATETDLRAGIDTDLALARARVRTSDAKVAVLADQVSLVELEQFEAEHQRDYAKARLAGAEQRMRLARSLYSKAEELAKLAQAESLDARRARLEAPGTP